MADPFDSFLSEALAAPRRDPDRQFVARVQARVALEARLEAERRSILRRFASQLIALVAIAGGLVWAARTEPLVAIASESPWLLMCGLLSIFALVVAALSAQGSAVPTLGDDESLGFNNLGR
jgi:hypothetical protein